MIYTDGVHLMSDTSLEELHAFAQKRLHFKRSWFQNHPLHPHYDLTTPHARRRAVQQGAKLVKDRELVRICVNKEDPKTVLTRQLSLME